LSDRRSPSRHDQQVEQHEADAEEDDAVVPGRDRQAELDLLHLEQRHEVEAGEQLDQADDGRDQRDHVDGPVRRRQPHREGDEEQLGVGQRPQVPRLLIDPRPVDAAREELVGLARVAREQQLQIARLEALRVDVEEPLGAMRGPRVGLAGGAGGSGGHGWLVVP
jgi:hypothetical protein